jgi:hypothetical protein
MGDDHKIVQISSHVTSLVGRVGIVGLCSCGWLGSAEGDNTKIATKALIALWQEDHGTKGSLEGGMQDI